MLRFSYQRSQTIAASRREFRQSSLAEIGLRDRLFHTRGRPNAMSYSVLDSSIAASLRCPTTGERLQLKDDYLIAASGDDSIKYPVVDGIPIILDDDRSVFSAEDIAEAARNSRDQPETDEGTTLKQRLFGMLPGLGLNLKAAENIKQFAQTITEDTESPTVLVLGGGVLGVGCQALADDPRIELVESDIYIGPRTGIVHDAHEIPFEDGTFDGVVIQGVLGVLLNPPAAVAEIHRVLKPNGLVYAESPFVQQNCVPFDYHRFSHLGLVRLFHMFSEIKSGAQGGPGMVLGWSYRYFLLSFASGPKGRAVAHVISSLTGWWPKLFDPWLIDRPGTIDAASGVFFLGRRAVTPVPDATIAAAYRGMVPGP